MKPRPSPLFIPALWEGDHFRIIDETLLPSKVEYITVRQVSEALAAVKEMKTRAFGQVLTFFYTAALSAQGYKTKECEALKARIAHLVEEFTQARPTFDFKGLAQYFEQWFRELPPDKGGGSWFEGKIHELVSTMLETRMKRAARAAELLPDPCRLLTHCNISGELVAVAERCRETGKRIEIIATETRPYMQGSRLTAWEIARAGIRVTLIPDCAVAQVMAKGEVNAVVVGADRSAQNGDIINKVGTYPIALMAKEYDIPFYALVQNPGPLARGKDVVIEERPVAELFTFQGRSYAPEGLKGRYPAFDLTPADLITSLISLEGVFTPEGFRQTFERPSAVAKNAQSEKGSYLLLYGIPKQEDCAYFSHALKGEQAEAILVPEMRPELWGVHLIARELVQRSIPTTLISDNMMGAFFAQRQIKRLYLFYSELTENGPVGICGSLLAALLARAHRVPVELMASAAERKAPLDRDVATFLGQRVSPEGVGLYPIEKEAIPWSLLKERTAGSS